MSTKTDLRRSLLAAREKIAPEFRTSCDAVIMQRLRAWLNSNPPGILGVYWPIKSEPDLRSLYADLVQQGFRLALPVVVKKNAPLEFASWMPGDSLENDAHGVPVPVKREYVRPQTILVPCVGFSPGNIRLGYGGGFYDRTLATSPRPVAVGIAYASTYAMFEAGPHDVALDVIITD